MKTFKVGEMVANRRARIQLFDFKYAEKNHVGVIIGKIEDEYIVKWEDEITLERDIYLIRVQ